MTPEESLSYYSGKPFHIGVEALLSNRPIASLAGKPPVGQTVLHFFVSPTRKHDYKPFKMVGSSKERV